MDKKKLKLEDLRLGMLVRRSQLDDIYDTHIILTDVKNLGFDAEGIISYIGENLNKESNAIVLGAESICPIYNDSSELEEDFTYEE